MTNIPMDQTLAEALRELVGKVLSSVEFVEDYVQLRFDSACLTAYTMPTITWGTEDLDLAQPGYRDALCRQIGCRVVRINVDDQQVSGIFDSGAVISISLREEDYNGPEALQFSLDEERIWVA